MDRGAELGDQLGLALRQPAARVPGGGHQPVLLPDAQLALPDALLSLPPHLLCLVAPQPGPAHDTCMRPRRGGLGAPGGARRAGATAGPRFAAQMALTVPRDQLPQRALFAQILWLSHRALGVVQKRRRHRLGQHQHDVQGAAVSNRSLQRHAASDVVREEDVHL